jgi:hypothetical protein
MPCHAKSFEIFREAAFVKNRQNCHREYRTVLSSKVELVSTSCKIKVLRSGIDFALSIGNNTVR